MLKILFTLMFGTTFGFVAKKVKFPAPYMLGTMIGAAIFSISFDGAAMPANTRLIAQVLAGIFVGKSIQRKDILNAHKLILPIAILLTSYFVFTFVMGFIQYSLFDFDLITSFLISIPGGITNVSLMSEDFGANSTAVSLIQIARLFLVMLFMPVLIGKISPLFPDQPVENNLVEKDDDKMFMIDKLIPDSSGHQYAFTLVAGILGGTVGYLSGVPAGTMTFSMISVAFFNCNSHRINLPRFFRYGAQIISGCLIGSKITMEDVNNLHNLILPIVVLMIGYFITSFLVSLILTRTRQLDMGSALFSSSPGGGTDLILIAGDFGKSSPKIAIMQIFRILSVNGVYPLYVQLFTTIFSGMI